MLADTDARGAPVSGPGPPKLVHDAALAAPADPSVARTGRNGLWHRRAVDEMMPGLMRGLMRGRVAFRRAVA